MRLNLPSNFYFYKQKKFETKPLRVEHIADIYEAQQQKSTRSLVTTLQTLTDFPLMEMLTEDFHWYIRQLALISYSKQAKTFEWTTRYGNNIVVDVDITAFKVEELKENFKLPEGYKLPTMADFCDIEEQSSISKSWLYTQAQYIDKPTWAERIKELTPDKLKEIQMLQNINFGVEEFVYVRDYKFDIDVWIAKCKDMIALLQDDKTKISQNYLYFKNELQKWEKIKEDGSPVEVEPEKVSFPISADILLPNLFYKK